MLRGIHIFIRTKVFCSTNTSIEADKFIMISWIKKCCFGNDSMLLCLRKIFRPLYIVLSLLGLFPYSIKFQNSSHQFSIIRKSIYINSICGLAYATIICFFLTMHIHLIYFSLEDSSLTEGIMTQMNYITELFSLTTFCIVTYVCVFLNRFKYVDILKILSSHIDPPNNNSEKVLKNLRFQINVVAMGSLSLTLLMQVCVNFTRTDSLWKMFLVVFTFNLPQMIQFTTIAFFYILIITVVGILRNIREQMLVLAKEKKVYMYGLTKVGSEQRVLTLRQIEIIYIEASEVKQSVNHIFEAQILVTMMQCFHSIVSESHIIYHGVVVQHNLEIHEIVNCSVWIIYQLMKIYAIASAGNKLKQEALKLGRALHNIPTERQDLRFMLEIQHFKSTMSFYGNELTVYGYFPLDATLTFKVVASAAMYIIILVQFDKTK